VKILSVTQVQQSNSHQARDFTAVTKDKHRRAFYFVSYNRVIYETRDFKTFSHIAGNRLQNYYVTGDIPTFGRVTGLLTPTIYPGAIFVVDNILHCIRKLDHGGYKYQDMEFAGSCTNEGSVDGTEPVELMEISKRNFIFVEKRKIRRLYLELYHWRVKTVEAVDQDIFGMTAHPTTNSIYIAFKSSLGILENNKLRLLTTNLRAGHSDGTLSTARIQNFEDLVFVNDELLLLADKNNGVLRLVNFADNTISTICSSSPYDQPESTSVTQCRLTNPHLFQLDETNKIVYIFGADGVNKLKYKSK